MKVKFSKSHDNYLTFYCLGCKRMHYLPINGVEMNKTIFKYDFNNDFYKPTITPDVEDILHGCSYSIKDGRITYSENCTHKLAGKSFHLPELTLAGKYWIYHDMFNMIRRKLPLHATFATVILNSNENVPDIFIDRLDMFSIVETLTYGYGIVLTDNELDSCHRLIDLIKIVYKKMIE